MNPDNPVIRHFRNASQQRLILYGVIVVAVIVAVILLFTLVSGSKSDKPTEFAGHDVLKDIPLIDGAGRERVHDGKFIYITSKPNYSSQVDFCTTKTNFRYNDLPEKIFTNLEGKIADFQFNTDLSKDAKFKWTKTDLPRLQTGMVGSQVWSIKTKCTSQYKDAVAKTLQQLDITLRLVKKYSGQMELVSTAKDINRIFGEKKLGSILSIDGGHSIDNKLSVLRLYHRLGVRSISLTAKTDSTANKNICNTPWSTSITNTDVEAKSLSDFGKKIVKEMNRLGLIIDLSHSSYNAQKAVLAASLAPVIFSSSVVGIKENSESIKDDILDLVKQKNGLVMISFDPTLIKTKREQVVKVEDVVKQLNYIREKIGADYVALGAGFSASDSVNITGLEDSSKYPELFDLLAKPTTETDKKWTKEELEKLAGKNFLRVFEDVEKVSGENDAPAEDLIPTDDISSETCYT